MAKREIRAVKADMDIAAVIDRGADIDTKLKNLGFEDRGIKMRLTEVAGEQLSDGELSVRLLGKESAAVISRVEKKELDTSSESFPKVRDAIVNGILDGIVSRSVSIAIPEGEIEHAAEELRKLGIPAVVTESFKIEDAYVLTDPNNKFVGSVQKGEAIAELSKCVSTSLSFRVKYERI